LLIAGRAIDRTADICEVIASSILVDATRFGSTALIRTITAQARTQQHD
jgi:hypothetical protein